MVIIGCDFHPGFQQIAMLDKETGEVRDLHLAHKQEAERFYASLRGREVLVGIEACGYTQWFEQMLEQMGHGYRIGDAAAIRASYVRKQKTDRRDAGRIHGWWNHFHRVIHRTGMAYTRFPTMERSSEKNSDLRSPFKCEGVSGGVKGQDGRHNTAPWTPPLTPTLFYVLTAANVSYTG